MHASNADRRGILHVHIEAGNVGKLGPQLLDDLIGTGALSARLQAQKHRSGIGLRRAAARDRRHQAIDIGVLRHDRSRSLLVLHHLLERGARGRFSRSIDLPGIGAWDEVDPRGHEHAHSGKQTCDETKENEGAVLQAPAQRALVPALQPVEGPLAVFVELAVMRFLARLQNAAEKHWGQRHRHDARYHNRDHDGHSEFVQQPPHNTAHEQNWDEHGHQRNRHRKNGEPDFLRTFQGRFEWLLTSLDMTHDVFEHDDGVVHHEAHRKRQRHQRKIVEVVAEVGHPRERANHRNRERQRCNECRRKRPQEHEYDRHHENGGD